MSLDYSPLAILVISMFFRSSFNIKWRLFGIKSEVKIAKMKKIINFFYEDALSFGILVLLAIFLINNFSWAKGITPKRSTRKITSTSVYKPASNLFKYDLGVLSSMGNNRNNLDINNTINYSNPGFIKLKTYLNYHNDLKYSSASDFSNLYAHIVFDDSYLSNSSVFSSYGIMILPLSKVSQQTETMQFGTGIGGSYYALFNIAKLSSFFKGNISVIKNFFKNETGTNNISNNSMLSNQSLSFGFSVQQLLAELNFKNTIANDFLGKTNSTNTLKQTVYWQFSRATKLGFGHSDTIEILNPNQEEIPLTLFQNKESTLFFVFNLAL